MNILVCEGSRLKTFILSITSYIQRMWPGSLIHYRVVRNRRHKMREHWVLVYINLASSSPLCLWGIFQVGVYSLFDGCMEVRFRILDLAPFTKIGPMMRKINI